MSHGRHEARSMRRVRVQVAVAVLYLHDVEESHGRENLSVVRAGSVVAMTGAEPLERIEHQTMKMRAPSRRSSRLIP